MVFKKRVLSIIFLFNSYLISFSQSWETDRAKPDGNGCLTYSSDENQNRIPDFSYAGYRGGGIAIPEIPTVLTIAPVNGDNTTHIQNAIDQVEAMPLDQNGFRGALLLEAGTYPVSGILRVEASGIVLRGVGDGREGNDTTIIIGTGDVPHQRNLIEIGGGTETRWAGQISGTRQDITSPFVQVGSHDFDIADASSYQVGDNIVIFHPCTQDWLEAVNFGEVNGDVPWSVDQFPIIFNRYVTAINGNTITVDAPVYNHLDRSLSQSYIYKYDRAGLVTNVGVEDLLVSVETAGEFDENHAWNCIELIQVEDAWVQNTTTEHFGFSGIITETASRVSVINCQAIDPHSIITGGNQYNFNCSDASNNVLFDRCYANNGRHMYTSNGVTRVSGMVVLRSLAENPRAASEGHRHWTTGMLFDNVTDFGSIPNNVYTLAFYNRGDFGTGHGWSAAHSVFWNCDARRAGNSAEIVVEEPPTAQNYAIGCFGNVIGSGPFEQADGYIEGSNVPGLEPASLYERQLTCRSNAVIAEFSTTISAIGINEIVTFTDESVGNITEYVWDFGEGAFPETAVGIGPHDVIYSTTGLKTVSLIVSNNTNSNTRRINQVVDVRDDAPIAIDDEEIIDINTEVSTSFLENDSWQNRGINNALNFDGNNDFVSAPEGSVNQFPYTMMAWIRTTSTSNDVIAYIGNGFSGVTGNSIEINNGRARLSAGVFNGSVVRSEIDGNDVINDGEWHHIAGVFENISSRRLYVDGVLVNSSSESIDITGQFINRLSVGNRNDSSPGNWFDGLIDELKVVNFSVSEEQLALLMKGEDNEFIDDFIVNWRFDEGTGTVANSFSTSNISGSVDGATWERSDLELSDPEVRIVKGPSNGIFTLENNEINYFPNQDYIGLDTITYQISDGSQIISTANILYTIGDVVTSVNEAKDNLLTYFPNPTTGKVHLSEQADYRLLDVYGKELKSGENAVIDLSPFNKGIYFIRTKNQNIRVIKN